MASYVVQNRRMPARKLAINFKTALEIEREAFRVLVQERTPDQLEVWTKAHIATQGAAHAYYAAMTQTGEWGGDGFSA
ncbi:hypothetical protein BH10PSE17_BH10PSE17_25000 [soil metagenome]